jgi:hypothetical protein
MIDRQRLWTLLVNYYKSGEPMNVKDCSLLLLSCTLGSLNTRQLYVTGTVHFSMSLNRCANQWKEGNDSDLSCNSVTPSTIGQDLLDPLRILKEKAF